MYLIRESGGLLLLVVIAPPPGAFLLFPSRPPQALPSPTSQAKNLPCSAHSWFLALHRQPLGVVLTCGEVSGGRKM